MRLLLRLKSAKNCAYDLKYYNKLQGFIYKLIEETEYSSLHDKKSYKFFSFSNIFPINDMKENDIRYLLISSPDINFIKTLAKQLVMHIDKPINIGEMQFYLKGTSFIKPKISKNLKLISATPIVIRIPENKYELYNIPSEFKKSRYVFWRSEYPFEAFIKQLEDNLFKKFNEFHKTETKQFPLFEIFKFKKSVANHVIINGKERLVIGSIWEFSFNYLDKEQKNVLNFGIETGFGELNSQGFGFINPIQ